MISKTFFWWCSNNLVLFFWTVVVFVQRSALDLRSRDTVLPVTLNRQKGPKYCLSFDCRHIPNIRTFFFHSFRDFEATFWSKSLYLWYRGNLDSLPKLGKSVRSTLSAGGYWTHIEILRKNEENQEKTDPIKWDKSLLEDLWRRFLCRYFHTVREELSSSMLYFFAKDWINASFIIGINTIGAFIFISLIYMNIWKCGGFTGSRDKQN